MAHWFITDDQEVRGPYSTEKLKLMVADGSVPADSLVWAKPQTDWVKADWWLNNHDMLLQKMAVDTHEQLWHYAHNGDTFGPMPRGEMIDSLAKVQRLNEVLVWTKGMKTWTEIYEFHDILEDLGCNRRQHPRAPCPGQVVLKIDDKAIIGQLASVSQGGLGVKHAGGELNIGDVCHVEIKSEVLPQAISASAAVQYITDTGFVGMRFQQIHLEQQNMLIDYVKSYGRAEAA